MDGWVDGQRSVLDEIVVVSGIDERQIEKKRLDRLSRTAVSTETRSESRKGHAPPPARTPRGSNPACARSPRRR